MEHQNLHITKEIDEIEKGIIRTWVIALRSTKSSVKHFSHSFLSIGFVCISSLATIAFYFSLPLPLHPFNPITRYYSMQTAHYKKFIFCSFTVAHEMRQHIANLVCHHRCQILPTIQCRQGVLSVFAFFSHKSVSLSISLFFFRIFIYSLCYFRLIFFTLSNSLLFKSRWK